MIGETDWTSGVVPINAKASSSTASHARAFPAIPNPPLEL